jgi:hypothetical protein
MWALPAETLNKEFTFMSNSYKLSQQKRQATYVWVVAILLRMEPQGFAQHVARWKRGVDAQAVYVGPDHTP